MSSSRSMHEVWLELPRGLEPSPNKGICHYGRYLSVHKQTPLAHIKKEKRKNPLVKGLHT